MSHCHFQDTGMHPMFMYPVYMCFSQVIYSLRKKCSELTEEELGKLSVQLLNCQSEAEERAVYPCTAKMV